MRFRCSATFTFPPPEPVVCEGTTPGIVISTSGDLSSGIYWDLTTDTNGHAFTNPSAFPLEIGDSVCVNESGEVVSFNPSPIDSQFFIDDPTNPITNKFPGRNLTPGLAQYFINQNIINPNATIVVTGLEGGALQIVVTINDSVTHTIAGLQVFFNDVPVFLFEAPFVCEKIKKKNGHGFFKPYVFVPMEAYPNIGRWIVDCQVVSPTKVCCIAVSSTGQYVSSTQCASFRKSDNEYIEFAIAEAQLQSSIPIIPPVPVDNLIYPYDGVYGNYYRFRAPFIPSSLQRSNK